MPSPVGHALGGLIIGLAGARQNRPSGSRDAAQSAPAAAKADGGSRTLVICAVAAVLPDLDFLWGRHNMETHSLGAAVLAGVVVLAWTRGRDRRLALLVALAWASHVLFDWLGSDDTPPLGVMALWPVSSRFYFAHAYVFEAISRRTWLPNFWSHNLYAVATEAVMLAPLAVAARALQRWRR